MYIDTENSIQIDHDQISSQHVGCFGMTGSGKTNAMFVWLEGEIAAGGLVTVIDSEGDFYPLKGCGLLSIGKGRKGNQVDIEVTPEQAARMAEIISSHRISVIVDLSGYPIKQRDAFVLAYLGRLWQLYQDEDLPSMRVVIDEVQIFAPQGKATDSLDLLLDIASRGRKRYFVLRVATQRPQSVNKEILDACAVRIFLKVELGRALAAIRELLPGEMQKRADEILPAFTTGQAVIKTGAASHIIQIRQSAIFAQKGQPLPVTAASVINEETIRALTAALGKPADIQRDEEGVPILPDDHPLVVENRRLREQIEELKKRIEMFASAEASRVIHPVPMVSLDAALLEGVLDTVDKPVQPHFSERALARQANAQQRTFDAMMREVRGMQAASRKILKELVIQERAVTAGELARLADLSESTVDHSQRYGPLVRLGLIKKLPNGKFISTADAYLRDNCANLAHDELMQKLASVI